MRAWVRALSVPCAAEPAIGEPARLPWAERVAFALAQLIHGDPRPAGAWRHVCGTSRAAGTIAPSPYTDRLRMMVVESGVPAPAITGTAVGADADDTGAVLTTRFGDISFGTRP
ncbi:MAG: hypothetical protein KDG52_03925 [Rhodocyclaceae bacterium]|nr:hypothetical protein [Rhodocyclaceae bacterium]